MKFVVRIVAALAGLATIVLAVANRQEVTFSIDPLPWKFDLPLFIVILVSVFVGVLIGAGVMWWRDGKLRQLTRHGRRDAARLRDELRQARTGAQLPPPTEPAGTAE